MYLESFFMVIILGIIIGIITYFITNAVNKNKLRKVIKGGCIASRWGCCPDGIIAKYDLRGTNCIPRPRQVNVTTKLN